LVDSAAGVIGWQHFNKTKKKLVFDRHYLGGLKGLVLPALILSGMSFAASKVSSVLCNRSIFTGCLLVINGVFDVAIVTEGVGEKCPIVSVLYSTFWAV